MNDHIEDDVETGMTTSDFAYALVSVLDDLPSGDGTEFQITS